MMSMTSLIFIFGVLGNITTGLVYLSPTKTFWRIAKNKSTEEFESIPYISKLLNAYWWVYYGIIKPNSVLVATVNGFGAVLELIYIFIFLLYAPSRMKVRTGILFGALDVVFPGVVTLVAQLFLQRNLQIDVAGFLSVCFSMVAYASPLSAMKTVVITKSVEYMPFLLTFTLFVNGGIWTVYAILTKDFFIGVPNGSGFILGTAQLILYVVYMKPKDQHLKTTTSSSDNDVEDGVLQHHQPLLFPNIPVQ